MGTELKPGDKVEWNTSQGKTHGEVVERLINPAHVKGHRVRATPENPEYLVESDVTGAKAAHKPQALRKTTKKTRDEKARRRSQPPE